MAWMRMMGADSVAYHRDTVLHRADDHPGQALAYYASRGETPLMWGGAGARALGLVGTVTEAQYEAIYGPGRAVDPTTGERLVSTRRPGVSIASVRTWPPARVPTPTDPSATPAGSSDRQR